MWKIEKQVTDGEGTHRWQSAGPGRYATREEAERGMRRAAEESLRGPFTPGYRSARFRVVKAVQVVACMVLQ